MIFMSTVLPQRLQLLYVVWSLPTCTKSSNEGQKPDYKTEWMYLNVNLSGLQSTPSLHVSNWHQIFGFNLFLPNLNTNQNASSSILSSFHPIITSGKLMVSSFKFQIRVTKKIAFWKKLWVWNTTSTTCRDCTLVKIVNLILFVNL